MTENDNDEIWTAYAKHVKPLKPRGEPSPSRRIAVGPSLSRKAGEGNIARGKIATAQPVDFHRPLDRNIEKRLRQGAYFVEARLDLHGMHQNEAHRALDIFIAKQLKMGRRCMLVITGKGRGNEGVLHTNLPRWLEASPFAANILALRPAAPKHGGDGAFYVMLRRPKNVE